MRAVLPWSHRPAAERWHSGRWVVASSCALLLALLPLRSPAEDVQRQVDVMMPARDGVLLATDIYRPAGKSLERLPVLLHRTPYDKAEPKTIAIAETLARHGYVVIVQDTRGRHHSQGVFVKYYDADAYDGYDGYDTIEWADTCGTATARSACTAPRTRRTPRRMQPSCIRPIWPPSSDAWTDLPPADPPVRYRQHIQEGAPDPAGHLQQQLPTLRRQPQHRRALGGKPTVAAGRQQRIHQCRTAVSADVVAPCCELNDD